METTTKKSAKEPFRLGATLQPRGRDSRPQQPKAQGELPEDEHLGEAVAVLLWCRFPDIEEFSLTKKHYFCIVIIIIFILHSTFPPIHLEPDNGTLWEGGN